MPRQPLVIDESDDFLACQIDGVKFEADICEALDQMGEVDRLHQHDLDSCSACGAKSAPRGDSQGKCEACGEENAMLPCQAYLDDVAAWLVKRYGLPRCSRRAAGLFYGAVTAVLADEKKTAETPPPSDTSSASTPPAGQESANEHGWPDLTICGQSVS